MYDIDQIVFVFCGDVGDVGGTCTILLYNLKKN